MMKPVVIPLAAGVQSELAAQLVVPGATLAQENVVSDQTGTARVRLGSDVLSTESQATIPLSVGNLPHPWKLAPLAGALVRFNVAPTPLHVWDADSSSWIRPSSSTFTSFRAGPMSIRTTPVVTNVPAGQNVGVTDVDAAGARAVVCSEYTTAAGVASRIDVIDLTTGTTVFHKTLAVGYLRARPLIVGNTAVIAYNAAGTLKIDLYDLDTFTFVTVTGGSCEADSVLDIRAGGLDGGDVSILYQLLTAPGYTAVRVAEVDVGGAAIASDYLVTTPTAPVSGLADTNLAVAWMTDGAATGRVSIIACSTSFGLYTLFDIQAPVAGSATSTLQRLDTGATATPSGATAGVRNVTGTTLVGTTYRVLYEVSAPDTPIRTVTKSALWIGSASHASEYPRLGLRSKLWKNGTDYYFIGTLEAQDQNTYFVCRLVNAAAPFTSFCTPQGVAFVRGGAGRTEKASHLSQVPIDSGETLIAVTHVTRPESIAPGGTATGTVSDVRAVDLIRASHRTSPDIAIGQPCEFAGHLFVPGAALASFDGGTYGLPGFAYYPPEPGSVVSGSGNLTPSANYFWKVCYSFLDKRTGRKWRSAPSVASANGTGVSDTKATISAETLQVVDREGYQVEFYRSQPNEADAFFLVASIPNDPTNDTVSIVDNVADADLGEELYTDGGGLENQLLPAASNVVEFQSRLFMAETGTATLWYSLEVDLNHGLLFNEALTFDVGDPSDPITGLAVVGEMLFVFKVGKIYVVTGAGANALGQGQSYAFRLVEPSVGCSNPASIVVADDGVWFRSSSARAGIHRTTGAAAEYVGQGVREHDSKTITASVVIRDRTEIRFYTLQGTTLVWNWTAKAWGTNTEQPTLCATAGTTVTAGVVYARQTDNAIMAESTTSYLEGAVTYQGRIRTPKYRLGGGLGGFGRLKRAQGIGTAPAPHVTTVNLYRNEETTPFQSADITFEAGRSRWDWELRPANQSMSTVMVEIVIGPADGPVYTAGPNMVAIALIPMAKEGADKLPASRRLT